MLFQKLCPKMIFSSFMDLAATRNVSFVLQKLLILLMSFCINRSNLISISPNIQSCTVSVELLMLYLWLRFILSVLNPIIPSSSTEIKFTSLPLSISMEQNSAGPFVLSCGFLNWAKTYGNVLSDSRLRFIFVCVYLVFLSLLAHLFK